MTPPASSEPSPAAGSFDLHQLQPLAAGSLDHERARRSERIGAFDRDIFALQLRHPCIEIGDAEPDVIDQMSARARERSVALAWIPREHHIAERDCGSWGAVHALAFEAGPGAVGG